MAPSIKKTVVRIALIILFFVFWEYAVTIYVNKNNQYSPSRPHPVLLWSPRPHRPPGLDGPTNSLGLRGYDVPFKKQAQETRILALGDSSIFGFGVAYDNTFEAVLQRLLEKKFPGKTIRVIDGGVNGYCTFQGLYFLKNVCLKYHPDIMIVGYMNSDSGADWMPYKRVNPNPEWVKSIQTALYESNLYLVFRKIILRERIRRADPAKSPWKGMPSYQRVNPADYRENLEKFARIADKKKMKVIYLNMPARTPPPGGDVYRAGMKEAAARYGIPICDLYRAFQVGGGTALFLDEVHPNEAGHAVAAREIMKTIMDNGWIKPLSE